MTDRHAGYLVTLENDVREDDAESTTLNAIRMVKGVISVTPVIGNIELELASQRVRHEFLNKILDLFNRE